MAICNEPEPEPAQGGLVVETEASGLCSGELMDWYMEGKIPHVLGHEVAGKVLWSDDERFPVGCRIAPHHHAPCLKCAFCRRGRYVHCDTWKRTRLIPGGMAERFLVRGENLEDAHRVDDLDPRDAALMEPVGCVAKSIRRAGLEAEDEVAVIGLGSFGVAHLLCLDNPAKGYDLSARRIEYAASLGLSVGHVEDSKPADVVFICPGNEAALRRAEEIVRPGGKIVLFAPFPPENEPRLALNRLYFSDVSLIPSYSCGPDDTAQAINWIRRGRIRASHLVSDFVTIEALPEAYLAMKAGEILKAMVLFER
ncbi:MAG: alcohol dehydrogenase catalytic domain-containing protein [Armatimonadetes bacterium]|nr:alcohol dehydrogenase catalytic domain-containing protein [Armatimonadota bacterium]